MSLKDYKGIWNFKNINNKWVLYKDNKEYPLNQNAYKDNPINNIKAIISFLETKNYLIKILNDYSFIAYKGYSLNTIENDYKNNIDNSKHLIVFSNKSRKDIIAYFRNKFNIFKEINVYVYTNYKYISNSIKLNKYEVL